MKRLRLIAIWGIICCFSFSAHAQLEEYLSLYEFPWSGLVSFSNDDVTVRTKPVSGYVVLSDNSIHFGKLQIQITEGLISEVKLKDGKWKSFNPQDVLGMGSIASPRKLMLDGRQLDNDTTENFHPVILSKDGTQLRGFLKQKKLVGGGRIFLFAESLDSDVELIYESEMESIAETNDLEMIRQRYDLEANRNIKYGMLVGNSVQFGSDGTHREGLRVRAVRRDYEMSEHHLYEASRAIYKGNFGYAGFMLGKGTLENVAPSDEQEVEVSAEVFWGRTAYGPFILRLFQALDTTGYEPADQWVLADYLNTYALFLHVKGKHKIAGSLFEYGLSVCQHLPEDAEIAMALKHNYALLQFETGHFREADSLLSWVNRKITHYKGEHHYAAFIAKNNHAMMLARMGSFDRARDMLQSLAGIADEVIPDYSIDDTRLKINQGLLDHQLGQLDEAMVTYIKVLETLRREEKVSFPDYTQTLLLLGDLYLDILNTRPEYAGNLQAFINAVKQTVEEEYSQKHEVYAAVLMLEGRYHLASQQYEDALLDFNAANVIYENNKGLKSYDYLASSGMIALCLWKTGKLDEAAQRFKFVAQSYLNLKSELFSTMSEPQREAFWKQIKPQIDFFSHFVAENADTNPEWLSEALNFRIQTKGLLYSSSSRLRSQIANTNDPVIRELFHEWVTLREELLIQYNLNNDDREKSDSREMELKDQLGEIEQKLAGFINQQDSDRTYKTLKQQLEGTEAIVEFVKIDPNPDFPDTVRYYAFIITSDDDHPQVVKLPAGDSLEKGAFSQYKNSISYRQEDPGSFEAFWAQIADHLNGKQKLYVVNDGVYNLINVEGLKTPEGAYVADNFEIVYLTGLNWTRSSAAFQTTKAMLVGPPVFGTEKIPALPGARKEIDSLSRLLKDGGYTLSVYTDSQASEQNFRAVNGAEGILHVATHGYFLEDAAGPLATLTGRPDFRSGLIFSEAVSDRPDFQAMYDGFFSTYEALNLDLQGIDLVVLSACETGKGNLIEGESVQGLARAFKIAGADHVIVSLWKVDDEATRELMSKFYSLWTSNHDFHGAFRIAKNELRKEYAHPYYWSGFVLLE